MALIRGGKQGNLKMQEHRSSQILCEYKNRATLTSSQLLGCSPLALKIVFLAHHEETAKTKQITFIQDIQSSW